MAKTTMECGSHTLSCSDRIVGGPSDSRQFEFPAGSAGCAPSQSYGTIEATPLLTKGAVDHVSSVREHAGDPHIWVVPASRGGGIPLPSGWQNHHRERHSTHGPDSRRTFSHGRSDW